VVIGAAPERASVAARASELALDPAWVVEPEVIKTNVPPARRTPTLESRRKRDREFMAFPER
jgi:hypothetical protein